MRASSLDTLDVDRLPGTLRGDTIYLLRPQQPEREYYRERTNRNVGWISQDEQHRLSQCAIGVAGCGGMGGLVASIFFRLGVGEVRIADCEEFDASNINRQFAATRSTVGKSKVHETAKLLRQITDDATLAVYPQGICEATARAFVHECNVVCDEIEFWAVGSRIRLHQAAREAGVPVFNCNTVGFGTRLFRFGPADHTMEELLGLPLEEAELLEERIRQKVASKEEVARVMQAVIGGLVPELPEYHQGGTDAVLGRLSCEQRASIIATNPPMAAGFLADHVLLHLLRSFGAVRDTVVPPPPPGYLYFDAALMQAKVVGR